jgi:hypothetical protein
MAESESSLAILNQTLDYIDQLSKHPDADLLVVDEGEKGKFRRVRCTLKTPKRVTLAEVLVSAPNPTPNHSLLFSPELADMIIEYFGHHNFEARRVCRRTLGCSVKSYEEFSTTHHDLAIEDFDRLKPFFLSWKTSRLMSANTDTLRNVKQGFVFRNVETEFPADPPGDFPGFIATLLHWSLRFENSVLHAALWATTRLERDLFKPSLHWNARLSACVKKQDLKQFRTFVGELHRDKRCQEESYGVWRGHERQPVEAILHDFFVSHWPGSTVSETLFLAQLVQEHLIPINAPLLLFTLYDDQPEHRDVIFNNFRTRRLQRLHQTTEEENEEEMQQWQEAVELFSVGEYESAEKTLRVLAKTGQTMKGRKGKTKRVYAAPRVPVLPSPH